MCERLLNLQEIYVSGQNICIEVYGNSVGTITPTPPVPSKLSGNPSISKNSTKEQEDRGSTEYRKSSEHTSMFVSLASF